MRAQTGSGEPCEAFHARGGLFLPPETPRAARRAAFSSHHVVMHVVHVAHVVMMHVVAMHVVMMVAHHHVMMMMVVAHMRGSGERRGRQSEGRDGGGDEGLEHSWLLGLSRTVAGSRH